MTAIGRKTFSTVHKSAYLFKQFRGLPTVLWQFTNAKYGSSYTLVKEMDSSGQTGF